MLLRCKNAFGNVKPGDEVEVPDGAQFDAAYFEKIAEFVVLTQELDPEEGK